MRVTNVLAATIAAVTLVGSPALSAADPWKNESGHGRGGGGEHKYEEKYDGHGRVKREWKPGDCKYEYKAGPDGVKDRVQVQRAGPSRRLARLGATWASRARVFHGAAAAAT